MILCYIVLSHQTQSVGDHRSDGPKRCVPEPDGTRRRV